MAYEASAANRIQRAETSSPRDSASTVQQTAPTTATAPQTIIDFGVIREVPPGGVPGRDVVEVDIEHSPRESRRHTGRVTYITSTPGDPTSSTGQAATSGVNCRPH